jgi:hypothetical protein
LAAYIGCRRIVLARAAPKIKLAGRHECSTAVMAGLFFFRSYSASFGDLGHLGNKDSE